MKQALATLQIENTKRAMDVEIHFPSLSKCSIINSISVHMVCVAEIKAVCTGSFSVRGKM